MKFFVLYAAIAQLAVAHISLISPCPRYSPLGENCPELPEGESYDSGDHAINGPIYSEQLGGQMPLGRHMKPWPTPAARWTAGQQVTVKFNPNAAIHSGGHCQFGISYNNGETVAVIHSELRYCFLGSKPSGPTNTPKILEYTFTLPADLPNSNNAVFSWFYINASGNREAYSNHVDVSITGSSSTSFTGPQMVIANYPGYPIVPEFNGDYETGIELYTNAPNVTISPSGSSGYVAPGNGSSNVSTGSSAPVSDPSADPVSNTNSEPNTNYKPSTSSSAAQTDSAAVASSPGPAEGYASSDSAQYDSTDSALPSGSAYSAVLNARSANIATATGTLEGSGSCTAGQMQCSGSGYQVCVGGQWSTANSCGTGTSCKGDDGHVYCGFA